jgi:hypothetical protein
VIPSIPNVPTNTINAQVRIGPPHHKFGTIIVKLDRLLVALQPFACYYYPMHEVINPKGLHSEHKDINILRFFKFLHRKCMAQTDRLCRWLRCSINCSWLHPDWKSMRIYATGFHASLALYYSTKELRLHQLICGGGSFFQRRHLIRDQEQTPLDCACH